MQLTLYQVDAFSSHVFGGNPAAVVPLEQWLEDSVMQAIAMENNLSETAFFVREGKHYALRWFTPTTEVDLCGHATLATAAVLFDELGIAGDSVSFTTRSGELCVMREGERLVMDFPAQPAVPCEPPTALLEALGQAPREVLAAADYLLIYDSENDIRQLAPDMRLLKQLDRRGVMATAPGTEVDFVMRFFAPKHGIEEDPVTGSAFCTLTPYWSARLKKSQLHAWQLSARGGEIFCEDKGQRVLLAGQVAKYLKGEIRIPG